MSSLPQRVPQEQSVSDAIVPAADVGAMLARPADLNARLDAWRAQYHVLSPATQVHGRFAPDIAMTASIVKLDATVDEDGRGVDTYFDKGFMKAPKENLNAASAQRALNKIGLMRIASCAGLQWTDRTGRRDDRRIAWLWEYFAEGEYLTPDGQFQTRSGAAEVDLRDGSSQIGGWTPEKWDEVVRANRGKPRDQQTWTINGWSDKRVMQARRFGLAQAETKAKLRAIREFGIKSVYTVEELQKPFVILRAVFQPSADNLEGRRMLAERALYGRRSLYPVAVERPALPEPVDAVPMDDPTVSPTLTAAPAVSSPPVNGTPPLTGSPASTPPGVAQTPAPSEAPPSTPALYVVKVEKSEVTRRSDGRKFPKWFVTDSNGEIHSTINSQVADLAAKLVTDRTPIDLVTSTNNYGSQIEELRALDPELPLGAEGGY